MCGLLPRSESRLRAKMKGGSMARTRPGSKWGPRRVSTRSPSSRSRFSFREQMAAVSFSVRIFFLGGGAPTCVSFWLASTDIVGVAEPSLFWSAPGLWLISPEPNLYSFITGCKKSKLLIKIPVWAQLHISNCQLFLWFFQNNYFFSVSEKWDSRGKLRETSRDLWEAE